MEEVTLPAPPQGYEYRMMPINKKPQIKDKDPSELTPRQKATLKYNEKNREKINEKSLQNYYRKKEEK